MISWQTWADSRDKFSQWKQIAAELNPHTPHAVAIKSADVKVA